jgi:hypothetical protein
MPQPDPTTRRHRAARTVVRALDRALVLFGRLPYPLRLPLHLAIAAALVASCTTGTTWPLSVARIAAALGYLAALERARTLTTARHTPAAGPAGGAR